MSNISSSFNAPWARKMDRDNIEKFGTDDLDVIELIETYADKNVEAKAEVLSEKKLKRNSRTKRKNTALRSERRYVRNIA